MYIQIIYGAFYAILEDRHIYAHNVYVLEYLDMYTYMCIYIYIYIYIYISVFIYISVYVYVCIYICICMCIYMYIYTVLYIYTHETCATCHSIAQLALTLELARARAAGRNVDQASQAFVFRGLGFRVCVLKFWVWGV